MEKQLGLLKEILNFVPFSVAVYTMEDRLAFCNQNFAELYGVRENGLESEHFSQVGKRQYYKISRLMEVAEWFRRGDSGSQSDLFAGNRRTYALLEQGGERLILEMIEPLTTPVLPGGQPEKKGFPANMVLSDRMMRSTVETIQRIANFDSTVLITGEAGTGKTMLARYIHFTSRRASAPFVTLDCASVPENLIESELFGYISGAVTEAGQKGKIGLVEAANGGTLFLDGIGVMPRSLQRKFLQLIQEKTYLPVGGLEKKRADVRIISASNMDLKRQVEEGLFREDLYYSLRVIEFRMPPLRERTDAMDPLIDHFVKYYNDKYQISKTISSKARDILKRHSWNGNISELQYVIERAMVTSVENEIDPGDIPPLRDVETAEEETHDEVRSFEQSVETFERKLLRQAYQKYRSSYKVAEALGISQTKASRLLRKYGIS